jgi:Tfp pilus assembly protein PilF
LTNSAKRKQHDNELAAGSAKGTADLAQVAKAYIGKGVKAYKEGDWHAAYENFDMAVKHNPQDGKAFHYLALAAARIPSFTRQAVQAIESAVQREPMNPMFLKDAGLLCKRAGLVAKAERYFEETLKWDASNIEAQTGLAELRETKEAGKGGFSIFGKR